MATYLGEASRERSPRLIGFFGKIYAIAGNTFVESVRQPVFAVVIGAAVALIVVSPFLTFFTLQQSPKLVADMGLATVMLTGLLLAAFSASNVIYQEIENRTALTVVAKPVGRMTFIIGKFLGVIMGLLLGVYLLSLALILVATGGADESQEDMRIAVVIVTFGAMFLSVCYGVYVNFFHDRPFTSRAIGAAVPLFTFALLLFCILDPEKGRVVESFGQEINLQIIYGCAMVLWSILLLASIAVAASTRLNVVLNLLLCSGVFILGLLSDFLFSREFAQDILAANVLYYLVPNLQVFWVADVISAGVRIPLFHVLLTGVYALCQTSAFLLIGIALFQKRELA